MSKRRQEHERRVLPLGSERVRRVLDVGAGEGPSQPSASASPPKECRPKRFPTPPPASGSVTRTPMKHRGVLRGIRRRMKARDPLTIDDYILDRERDERRSRRGVDGWSSEDDISLEEDSEDEYLPPEERRARFHESELDFSGFSALEEEEEVYSSASDDSESDGESEGDGPLPRKGYRRAVRGRRGRARVGKGGRVRGRASVGARSGGASGSDGGSGGSVMGRGRGDVGSAESRDGGRGESVRGSGAVGGSDGGVDDWGDVGGDDGGDVGGDVGGRGNE